MVTTTASSSSTGPGAVLDSEQTYSEGLISEMPRIPVRVPPDLQAALKALVVYTGESQNTVFLDALRAYVAQRSSEIKAGMELQQRRMEVEHRLIVQATERNG